MREEGKKIKKNKETFKERIKRKGIKRGVRELVSLSYTHISSCKQSHLSITDGIEGIGSAEGGEDTLRKRKRA